MAEEVGVRFEVDSKSLEDALANLEKLSASFGTQLTSALKSATVGGKELDDVLRQVGLNLAGLALNQGLKPLQSQLTQLFSSQSGTTSTESALSQGVKSIQTFLSPALSGLTALLPFAKGGVVPFAAGGVVSTPTFFQAGRSAGLMGEAGAEAILPLQRGADGRLGVAASGGGAPVSVVFNVTAQDAASFRKSEAQVTGMLARAVSRGVRAL